MAVYLNPWLITSLKESDLRIFWLPILTGALFTDSIYLRGFLIGILSKLSYPFILLISLFGEKLNKKMIFFIFGIFSFFSVLDVLCAKKLKLDFPVLRMMLQSMETDQFQFFESPVKIVIFSTHKYWRDTMRAFFICLVLMLVFPLKNQLSKIEQNLQYFIVLIVS